jgi:GINS complex subunit 1
LFLFLIFFVPFHPITKTMSVASSRGNSVQLVPNSGRELLLDLKRSTARNALGGGGPNAIPSLPPYNHKLVQACFRDLHGTARELELKARLYGNNNNNNNNGGSSGGGKPSMSARPSILLHNTAVQRHKRCLLAYHHHRIEIIKAIQRQTAGGDQSGDQRQQRQPPISTNAQEVAFARDYAALREAYSSKVFELDLLPPTSHMVQVRVLKEAGQVVLPDSGRVVAMTQGACLFLDRADARDFLRQGIVQLYDGEEVDF